ncbi:NAD(P)/FAD-dependent oxidoreductase [Roseobacter weihaiensis]|uniref:NAD(P)/FAD-dependent oxidoreductase n=1 Tax=Roseobacter weihaiensis TaxID=2763262 RepID=UPI001D0AFDF1|nr:FAD-binding oxidoreductase [Roseobacter sp. H9]
MRRIFAAFAYEDVPRKGCWWDKTCEMPPTEVLEGSRRVQVAIIGGGFTGVSAALYLATAGASVAVLEAQDFGWGASGRNGGFCCLGGGMAEDAELDARFGRGERIAFRQAEKSAVLFVENLIRRYRLDVDRHSQGETELAHRPKDMKTLQARAARIFENYGVEPQIIEKSDLEDQGMKGGPFFGALTVPLGFGLNPRKYLAGLVKAARSAGAQLFRRSPVTGMTRRDGLHHLTGPSGTVIAEHVIVATNGYSSEDLPDWLAGRYMPGQSTVLVTRPLSKADLEAQGWTTDQMCYDTRHLLHYFRLMPDGRFLFGMRGALLTGPRAEAAARRKVRQDFESLFPRWAHIESPNSWSGMVSLARKKLPFVGEIPGLKGVWAAMCYHGNGVAMGSYAGRLAADLALGRETGECPSVMRAPLARFPLGRARRALMPPLYAQLMLADRV